MDSLHCTRPSLALWVSGIGTKALNSYLYFMAKEEDKRCVSCSHVAIKAPKGECFLNWQLDRICKMRVGLCFFLFTYITYALIFKKKKPKMKENLTSGMPENLEHILFA